jgi:hypothetical protein
MDRIIQSYNTFGGERLNAGFSLLACFKEYLANSYKIHKQLTDDYKLYTDVYGYEVVKNIIADSDIEVIQFSLVNRGRYVYSGKMDVQKLQTKRYNLVDLDAMLFELPNCASDISIITEGMMPEIYFYKTHNEMNVDVKGITDRPMSGIIGFTDIAFKDLYISEVEARYPLFDKLEIFEKSHAIMIEETLLMRLAIDHKKKFHILEKFEHLRENLK